MSEKKCAFLIVELQTRKWGEASHFVKILPYLQKYS